MKAIGGLLAAAAGAAILLASAAVGAAPAGITQAASRNGGKEFLNQLRASGHRLVLAPMPEKDGTYDLYVANADGSQPVNISNTPDKDERLPRVNPKTGRIAFATATSASGTVRDEKGRHGTLAFMDAGGGNREETEVDLAADKDWNPEGTKITLSYSNRKKFGFRIYDPKTKEIASLAKDKNGIVDIDWSPDGKRMAFATRKELGFRYTILTMKADGTGIRPFCLGVDNSPYCHPSWHPSEMRIAWNSRQGLLVGDYDPNDGKAKNVRSVVSFKDVGWEDPCPRWSPDGAYIAFISRAKRLRVVRAADSMWAELELPRGWKFAAWDYDWLVKEGEKTGGDQGPTSEEDKRPDSDQARPSEEAEKPAPPVAPRPRAEPTPEEVCRGWFSLAMSYKRAGQKDKAREYLQRIVKEHPRSEYAVKAGKEMQEL